MALAWDRADIAQKDVLVHRQHWKVRVNESLLKAVLELYDVITHKDYLTFSNSSRLLSNDDDCVLHVGGILGAGHAGCSGDGPGQFCQAAD